jgi:8-oxo-dGTP pyrophosphatase MutT (NUDIX family)
MGNGKLKKDIYTMHPSFVLLLFFNVHHEVLLLRRINTPFCNNCYSLPGGKIEAGETAMQACVREAYQSLGITINCEDLEFVHVMHRKCNEPEFFACIFKPRKYHGDLRNTQLERHDDMQWFALDKLPINIVSAHTHALQMVEQDILYSEHGWGK